MGVDLWGSLYGASLAYKGASALMSSIPCLVQPISKAVIGSSGLCRMQKTDERRHCDRQGREMMVTAELGRTAAEGSPAYSIGLPGWDPAFPRFCKVQAKRIAPSIG